MPKSYIAQADRETFFAFTHGIRLTFQALNLPFDDGDIIDTLIQRMKAIVASPRNSLIRADDSVDMDQFRRLREIERDLCVQYIQEVIDANQPEQDEM